MQKGDAKLNALLLVLVIVAVTWLIWYRNAHGVINFGQILGF